MHREQVTWKARNALESGIQFRCLKRVTTYSVVHANDSAVRQHSARLETNYVGCGGMASMIAASFAARVQH